MDRTDSCTLSRNKPIHSANCAVSLVCPIVCRALALKSVLTFKSFTFLPFSEEYMQKYRNKNLVPGPHTINIPPSRNMIGTSIAEKKEL